MCKSMQDNAVRAVEIPPLQHRIHGEEDQPAPALHVGRRGYLQAALSKQKVHDTKNASCCNRRFA